MNYIKILFLSLLLVFSFIKTNGNTPLNYKLPYMEGENLLFYLRTLLEKVLNDEKETYKMINELRSQNNLKQEAALYLDLFEFNTKLSLEVLTDKEVMDFYNKYIEKVTNCNFPSLSIALYNIPIMHYERINKLEDKKKLFYYYQNVYLIWKNNPNLKYYDIEVEILRITDFYMKIGHYKFVKNLLQAYYERTAFDNPINPRLGSYNIYHCNNLAISYYELREPDKAIFFYELGKKRL